MQDLPEVTPRSVRVQMTGLSPWPGRGGYRAQGAEGPVGSAHDQGTRAYLVDHDGLRRAQPTTGVVREQGNTVLDPRWLAEQARLYTAAARAGFNVSSARRNEVEAKHNALAAGYSTAMTT